MADLAPHALPTLAPRPNRPRVAILSLHTSPTAALGHSANGGLNVYVRETCRAFSALGVATDVFTRVPGTGAPAVEHLAPHSRVVSLPSGEARGKYELVAEVERFATAVDSFAAEHRVSYDLIYSHYWLSGAAAAILRDRWNAGWSHTAHTLAIVKNRSLAPGDIPEPRIRELIEADIATSADLLVVSTAAEADDIRHAYGVDPGRMAVVAPGVDLSKFRPAPRSVALRRLGLESVRPVLFVGRLERLKGAEVAVRAFAAAAVAHPDATLLVLGGDSRTDGESERERLSLIASDLGIGDRVRFVGSVPHADLPLYYSASVALLMPSYNESFGLVGLEAQACGCPVIAANVAGLASVVRDEVTGFLVEGHDAADYADRLRRLLDDPEMSAQLGRRGTLLAQRFTWERTGRLLLSAFEPLMARQVRVQVTATHE